MKREKKRYKNKDRTLQERRNSKIFFKNYKT